MTNYALTFASEADASSAVDVIHNIAAAYYSIEKGRTVVYDETEGAYGLVAINARTGADVPNSLLTTRWDVPRQSSSGTWWFLSPSNNEELTGWADRYALVDGAPAYTEIVLPDDWF